MIAATLTRPRHEQLTCWCGERRLKAFSPEYVHCATCGTLVSRVGLSADEIAVANDDQSFYGRNYWLTHQTENLGNPTIVQRARADMPERCMHWLRTMLRFKPPPARVLEIGCAHGGFVALLRWVGYDALGLEMSPWVVDFARATFDVPMLLGPIEQQSLAEKSLDAIVLNDVVEHLADPRATLGCCARLLKDDGVFVIQMPDYPERDYEEMRARKDYFLNHMDGKEHLHLFSRRAARRLLADLGFTSLQFEPAMFESYDMYFVAGRQPLVRRDREELAPQFLTTPAGRVSLAWIDLLFEFEAREADRAARLAIIHQLHARLRRPWSRVLGGLRRLFRAA